MSESFKNQQQILEKLGIDQLNEMQLAAQEAIGNNDEIVLLSPTGTGKTLAFLLPIVEQLNVDIDKVQALILVPSRELAIQIEQVLREMGSGYKVNAVYGGRSGSGDKILLSTPPAILIGTPGRVADHLRRGHIDVSELNTLVLDEFDKSLETGFENEMREIAQSLPQLKKKILTSATQKVGIPPFMKMSNPKRLIFLSDEEPKLQLKIIVSTTDNRLVTLNHLINHLRSKRGIIFCNLKDTIADVSDYLWEREIQHSVFYGGLEQLDRERALIKFRNGTHKILLATDLAARGIDVPELDYIIHYQLPYKREELIHRNGRTARMHASGTAYMIKHQQQELPDFIEDATVFELTEAKKQKPDQEWETLYISGGRKDKISKGDIAGLFFKQGNLEKNELGVIELKQDCAFVAVPYEKAFELINTLNNSKIKKRKVRISLLED
ncbi:Superfamily II DNA and RNA helicase [Nonlabens sp. Hel1_33_55]|uniref:DEAD/DEAH box helicase n=1 Tax=Nonlabens sp. Hel1_33_55 TaxID=1336802 RepID=UPI000875B0D1|nr:DEAD/DEAH box helicase [Nonlabens sp. Hel1_33_55]SCY02282.1 Superfamily II DNA and RNA helicase [Nonlabens sp. Hel1_33_55]